MPKKPLVAALEEEDEVVKMHQTEFELEQQRLAVYELQENLGKEPNDLNVFHDDLIDVPFDEDIFDDQEDNDME
jgi:hypothetical protein